MEPRPFMVQVVEATTMKYLDGILFFLGIVGTIFGGIEVLPSFMREEQEYVSAMHHFLFWGGIGLALLGTAGFLIVPPTRPKKIARSHARQKKQRR